MDRLPLEPPSAGFKISSANRQAVKDWLAAQGFDATRVQSMRDQTLLKAYTDPRYLRALTNRGDYNPSVERGNDAPMAEAELPRKREGAAAQAAVSLDNAPAGPEHTQPLTEARVIELIRALAVLKPGLEGLEDLL